MKMRTCFILLVLGAIMSMAALPAQARDFRIEYVFFVDRLSNQICLAAEVKNETAKEVELGITCTFVDKDQTVLAKSVNTLELPPGGKGRAIFRSYLSGSGVPVKGISTKILTDEEQKDFLAFKKDVYLGNYSTVNTFKNGQFISLSPRFFLSTETMNVFYED
jgi:hypothetical protein